MGMMLEAPDCDKCGEPMERIPALDALNDDKAVYICLKDKRKVLRSVKVVI